MRNYPDYPEVSRAGFAGLVEVSPLSRAPLGAGCGILPAGRGAIFGGLMLAHLW